MAATTLDVAAKISFATLLGTFSGEVSMLDTAVGSNFSATDTQLAKSFATGYKMGFVFGLTASISPAVALAAGSAFGTAGIIAAADSENWNLVLFRAGIFGSGTLFAVAGYSRPTAFEVARALEYSYAVENDLSAYDDLDLVVDDAGNVTVREPTIHGNSLDYPGLTQGYTLRDRTTGEILKYGQTIQGLRRFSQVYLKEIDAEMNFEAEGSKREMRAWETQQIVEYMAKHGGKFPPLNKCTH
jgi:hypothetical protein